MTAAVLKSAHDFGACQFFKKTCFFLVKFLTKVMKFTKLNNLNMVEIHVNHGFEHVGQNQKSCYKSPLVQRMKTDI